MSELGMVDVTVGDWRVAAAVFEDERERLAIPVVSIIGNSVPSPGAGKRKLTKWKKAVASAAKGLRGAGPLDPEWYYCISAGFSFCPGSHGYAALDVENFLKPAFDALAAGLFCSSDQDPREIPRYGYDDSNFRYLFIHRLDDAESAESEGAGFVVSIRK